MALIPELSPHHREFIYDKYVLAADLGQSNDPTAIAVINHRRVVHKPDNGFGKDVASFYDVRHLARLPLGLSYVEQVAEVGRLLARPPLNTECELIIDETGVGRPVGDLFDTSGMRPTRVTITTGDKASSVGRQRWHVPKGILISTLDARLHTGELRFAAELSEASAMGDELKDFRRKVSAAGRYSYEARVGRHDDLVLAVAIGLWAIVGRPKPSYPSSTTYSFSRGNPPRIIDFG